MLIALGVSEVERSKIIEDLGRLYDNENSAEGLGCKGTPEQMDGEKKRTLIRNVALGAGVLTAAGVGSYFLFFRG